MSLQLRSLRHATLALVLTTAATAQTTWVVDDDPGPGVDFPDIQSALAVATPFDLVDVFPGQYPAFTMSAPARVMGRPGAVVSGHSTVRTIGPGRWALVADLTLESLNLESAPGTIVLDGVTCTARRDAFIVNGCADVRARGLEISGGGASGGVRVRVTASRLQLDDSTIRAASPAQEGDFGQTAILASAGSFVHLSSSTVIGGRGGDGVQLLVLIEPGDGGPALVLDGGSTTRVVRSTLRGGAGGFDPDPPYEDGDHGSAIVACGGAHEAWASTIEAGTDPASYAPPAPDTVLDCGATLTTTLDLPSFRIVGTPSPGTTVTLESGAGVGTSIRVIVGRFPVMVPTPGTTIPRLVDLGRIGSFGAVPASGLIEVPTVVPNWPRGSLLFMQTSRTGSAGTDFANSALFLVR